VSPGAPGAPDRTCQDLSAPPGGTNNLLMYYIILL
jgi:hypothetical protein